MRVRLTSINMRLVAALVAVVLGAVRPLSGIILSHMRRTEAQAIASDGEDMTGTANRMLAAEATQQNAAIVEQSTAASRALSEETETLSGLIGRFRIGDPAPTAAAAPIGTEPPRQASRSVSRPPAHGNTARKLAPADGPAEWR